MNTLNILHLEDNPHDVELVRILLKKELELPLKIKRVEKREQFLESKDSFYPDIILSDIKLPAYSGFEALKDARKHFPNIPFIVVTGTMPEEMAADSIKAGAWDYVVKERLIRLVSAMKNALAVKAERDKQIQIQNELKISQERLAMALQGSQDAIWDWDMKTNIQYFSEKLNTILGLNGAELTMDHDEWLKKIHPDDLKEVMKKLDNHLSGKAKFFKAEYRLRFLGDEYRWILSRGKAIFDKEGNPYRMSGFLSDINERKASELRLKTLNRAVHNAPVSVVLTNQDGIIEYVNPKLCEVTGYSFNELIGKNPRLLKSDLHDEDFYKKLWKKIMSGEEWKGVFRNKKKNGEYYWEQASISSISGKNGKITHYIAIKEDITQRVAFEKELIMAKEKAEESDRLKSSFLANMSHEIRTPMNGIIGFTDLIIKPELPHEKKIFYAEIIKSSTNRLLRLLTDIIDYSRIDAGQIEIYKGPFNLNLLIDQVRSETLLNNVDKIPPQVKLYCNLPLENGNAAFFGDEIRIKQILMNLVQNALKFTREGKVEIGYHVSKKGPVLYVKDTGIGIPLDKQSIIFDHFRQADESSMRSYEGAGLGLSITKGLTRALDGKIWLDSVPGKGTTFYVQIPMQSKSLKQKMPDIAYKPVDNQVQQEFFDPGKKVLVVEDEEFNQQLLKEFFESLGGHILYASTGEEAIDLFRENKDIELVLMDMRLPGKNGIEVTREIRQINPDVKVIAQTAFAMSNDRQKFLEGGADDYIEKPYIQEDLLKVIHRVLGSSSGLKSV